MTARPAGALELACVEEQRAIVTMDEAKAAVAARGGSPASWSWEDESHVYAFSREDSGPVTFGHAKVTVHWNKRTGWYTERGTV